jgi:hypothetical protein
MNSVKKTIQSVTIFFILFCIVLSSIKLTFDGYYGFYFDNKKVEKTIFSTLADRIYDLKPIFLFRSYTGFETGYGFFGPNVSSDFVTIFKIYDDKGKLVKLLDHVNLESKEGNLRFATLNSLFLEKLTDKENKKYNQYLDIVIKQISKYVIKDYPKNYKIETELYLFDYPTIETFNRGVDKKLILIKKYAE